MTACSDVYYWEVAQSVDNISKIEIVEFEDGVIPSVICEIAPENYDELINDVQTMPARKYIGSLASISRRIIKISFLDETYDIISLYEPRHITEPDYGISYSKITWLYFNSKDFEQLINKWIEKS